MIVNYTIKMHFHLLSFFLLLSTLGKPTSKDSMIIWEWGGGKRTKRKDTLKKNLVTINLLVVTLTVQLNDELSLTCSEIKV